MASPEDGCGREEAPNGTFHEAAIGLGSNLGHPPALLSLAWQELRGHPDILPLALSSLYATQPVDMASDQRFANAAALVLTPLPYRRLLHLLHTIERRLGRLRDPHGRDGYQDRTLDLDLLLYDNLVLPVGDVILPHPRLEQRLFVLVPLAEIARDRRHPRTGKSMGTLCAECEKHHGNHGVDKIFREWWPSFSPSRP